MAYQSGCCDADNSWYRKVDEDEKASENMLDEATVSRHSWAAILSKSLIQNSNKNVLEVLLEKDTRGSFVVSEIECAKLLSKLGLDVSGGSQVEGVQICPYGSGVIFITLKETVDM